MTPVEVLQDLDGPTIRKANRGDSHESIRANRFVRIHSLTKKHFHSVRVICANHLKTAIRNF